MKRSLRIVLLIVGSVGDLYPILALGQGLQERGHIVTIATQSIFQRNVRELGLNFAPLSGNHQAFLQSEAGERFILGKYGLFESFKPFKDELAQHLEEAWNICQDAEAVGFAGISYWPISIIEKLEIPCFFLPLFPINPTRQFPWLGFDRVDRKPGFIKGLINLLGYYLIEFVIWQRYQGVINTFRKESLKLPPVPWLGYRFYPPLRKKMQGIPLLYRFSPQLLTAASDWAACPPTYMPGFFFLANQRAYVPPSALTEFINAGPPPIYIGFGSMVSLDPEGLTQIIIKVVECLGKRAVLLSGWAGLGQQALPNSIFLIDNVPHDWLFPQMSVVVHHGGSGTMAAAMKAGIPQVTVPFFFDQPPLGQRLAALGVSPEPIPYSKLSVEALAKQIAIAATDLDMRNRAKAIAQHIRAENGVQNAIDILSKYFSKPSSPV
ncbi:MAG: glycosyltransferase [Cyanobacteria bacterium P01_F01_bin.150]